MSESEAFFQYAGIATDPEPEKPSTDASGAEEVKPEPTGEETVIEPEPATETEGQSDADPKAEEAEGEASVTPPEVLKTLERFGGDPESPKDIRMAEAILEGTRKVSSLGKSKSEAVKRYDELVRNVVDSRQTATPDAPRDEEAVEGEGQEDRFSQLVDETDKTILEVVDRRDREKAEAAEAYDTEFQRASDAAADRLEDDEQVGSFFQEEGSFEKANAFIQKNPFLRGLAESINVNSYQELNLEDAFEQLQRTAALMMMGIDSQGKIQEATAQARRDEKTAALKATGAVTQGPGSGKKGAPSGASAEMDKMADAILNAKDL